MKKIIGIIRPFDIQNTFYVYEDGNKIDMVSYNLSDVEYSILDLCNKYDITQVDLTGPKSYIKGIETKIKEVELTKYNKSEIVVNII